MISLPLYIYEKEQRYGIFISFLLRTYFRNARATKKEFINTLITKGFKKETLRKVWDRGIVSKHTKLMKNNEGEEYLAVISKNNKQYSSVIMKVSEDILKSVKTLADLNCFLTALHAGRPMKINKDIPLEYCQGRRLKKIGKSTGTVYKTTVSRRVKKAVDKFGLQRFHRFQETPLGNMQIENAYYFGVDYIFNVYNKLNSPIAISLKDKVISKGCTKTIEFYNLSSNGKKESSFDKNRSSVFSEIYSPMRSVYSF